MKIVIEIPKGLYYSVVDGCADACTKALQSAFKNGTPLPKGHGALIDRKNVIDVIDWYRLNPQHFSIDNVIDDIKCMEFLVEADKEGAE